MVGAFPAGQSALTLLRPVHIRTWRAIIARQLCAMAIVNSEFSVHYRRRRFAALTAPFVTFSSKQNLPYVGTMQPGLLLEVVHVLHDAGIEATKPSV